MRVRVNGVWLYFDVEGLALRPSGDVMREVPTVVLLHGGPGADHSVYKPAMTELVDVAQVVYLDHRGNGRSERGMPEDWTIRQWADDVKAFCDAVGIVRPFVYGASFGGMVAMTYAIRHPSHPGGLVLVSSAAQTTSHTAAKLAMFARLGGEEARELAHRRLVLGDTGDDVLQAWLTTALPLYTRTAADPSATQRILLNREVTAWFSRPGGEAHTFDVLRDLSRVRCPTLVLAGKLDPMLPVECQRDIAAALPPGLVTYHEFDDCGHGVVPDVPDQALPLVAEFIREHAQCAAAGDAASSRPAR